MPGEDNRVPVFFFCETCPEQISRTRGGIDYDDIVIILSLIFWYRKYVVTTIYKFPGFGLILQ